MKSPSVLRERAVQSERLPKSWVLFLIVIVLMLGIYFRFIHLDRKVYWIDETYTSLRISGHTTVDLGQHKRNTLDGRIVSVESFTENLRPYQGIDPKTNLTDTMASLAKEDPQHPPLYYLMARFWVQWFGNSVTAIRSLSALISLLTFPGVYWLCWELFQSQLVGLLAIALIAVSPVHVLYAQEARQYGLWTVMILLSSAAVLRAARQNTRLSWGAYSLLTALGLYTFPFHGLVLLAHGVYIAAIEKFRLTRSVINYLLASLIGLVAYLPWLLVIAFNIRRFYGTTLWTFDELSAPLYSIWLQNLGHAFLDVNLFDKNLIYSDYFYPLKNSWFLIAGLLALTVYSFYFLYRKAPKSTWIFLLALTGFTGLALIVPDLILGGRRSTVPRYIFPCYLGIQIAIAFLLATKLSSISARSWHQKFWKIMTIVLLSLGIGSCFNLSQAESSWNKYPGYTIPEAAKVINAAAQPLVISESSPIHLVNQLISLSRFLEAKVQLLLVSDPQTLPKVPAQFSDVFLYVKNPSRQLKAVLGKNYKLEHVEQDIPLWRLKALN